MPITLVVPGLESFDDSTQRFVYGEPFSITLEHSLVSLSRWESKWHKFFLGSQEKTDEETLTYIQCMGLGGELPTEVMERFSGENLADIVKYIDDPMTATTFSHIQATRNSREEVSNELIYYWMHTMGIDKSCETWHLARLITLIRLTSEKNKPAKKMNKAETAQQYKEINARNKALFNTPG